MIVGTSREGIMGMDLQHLYSGPHFSKEPVQFYKEVHFLYFAEA
jgi:hypothetical protein